MRTSEKVYRAVAGVVWSVGAAAMAIFGPPGLAVLMVVVGAIQLMQVVYGK